MNQIGEIQRQLEPPAGYILNLLAKFAECWSEVARQEKMIEELKKEIRDAIKRNINSQNI